MAGKPRRTAKFTATEMEAAENLVLLSESSTEREREGITAQVGSSSSASSSASVNTRLDPAVEESVEKELTGPWARRHRYRTVADVYRITARIDERKKSVRKRKGKE